VDDRLENCGIMSRALAFTDEPRND